MRNVSVNYCYFIYKFGLIITESVIFFKQLILEYVGSNEVWQRTFDF